MRISFKDKNLLRVTIDETGVQTYADLDSKNLPAFYKKQIKEFLEEFVKEMMGAKR